MKVKELIDILKECDPNHIVLVSEDPEGNGYMAVSDISTDMVCTGTYRFEIGYKRLTPELVAAGYSEEDILEDGKDCVIIWP